MPSIPSKLSLRIDVALIAVVDRVLSLSSTLPKKLVEGTVGVIAADGVGAVGSCDIVDVDGVGTSAGATERDRRWRMKLASYGLRDEHIEIRGVGRCLI